MAQLLVIWGLTVLMQLARAQTPLSPCPRVFRYDSDGSQFYGLIDVPSVSYGSALRINLKMSLKAQLPTKYAGRLELLGSRDSIVQNLMRGRGVQYRVHFPLLHPVPRPTLITINDRVICQGPPEIFTAAGQYITNINLDHVLYTGQNQGQNGGSRPPDSFGDQRYPGNQNPNNNQGYTSNGGNTFSNQGFPNTNYPVSNNFDFGDGTTLGDFVRPGSDIYNVAGYEIKPSGDDNVFIVNYENRPDPDTFARPSVIYRTTTTTPAPTPAPVSPPSSTFSNTQPPSFSFDPQQPPQNNINYTQAGDQCGVPQLSLNPLILGGTDAVRGDWPWLTALFMKKVAGLDFICSGSLVSARHVVTAAHCTRQKSNRAVRAEELVVRLGAFNLQDWADSSALTLETERIVLHPSFVGGVSNQHDIAVISVRQVTFTRNIAPVCLWQGNADLAMVVGKRATVVGWGRDENGLMATPEPRLTVVPIVATDTCRGSKQEFFYFTSDTTLCAGNRDGTGPCNGDSGGGLYISQGGVWMLRGIVSLSLKSSETQGCDLQQYVIYTDAAQYLPWLRTVLSAP